MPNKDDQPPSGGGKLRLPTVLPGMNKIAPTAASGTRGAKDDDKTSRLGLSSKETKEVLDRARKRMDRASQAESENRKKALDDLKFKAGQQWPADIQAMRQLERKPCLTINKIPTFVNQVTNDQRQNRPAIDISPVGDKGDPEVARMYRGLIRFLERESHADIAYDTAFDNSASNGFGYWRTLTEWEAPDSMDQTIVIKRIRNPFSVYLDPDHQEPDGSDARWAFVTEMITRDQFKEDYPKADPMPYTQGATGDKLKLWSDKEGIRIAEYFEITTKKRTLVALSNGHTGWEDELDSDAVSLINRGKIDVLRSRESEVPTVKWYKLTAVEVLECRDWPGKWIPIVKVIGNEIDIEGKVEYSGVIRHAKDAQRAYNYWKTKETEAVALAPLAPYIMEEGQVEGHETMWKQANTKSFPYLLYKAQNVNGKPAPPPQRQPFAGVPAGIANAMQGAAQDMMATTGIRFDGTMNERMQDESGRAIQELRRTGDIGSFHYVDNLSRSLKHQGDIFVDLIPKVIDTKRVMTILREDDTEERVILDPSAPKPVQEMRDPQTGKATKIFNPTLGKYGVTVTIGPSYATKRIEASKSMMDFARALPNTATLIADLIAKNQDWPGAEEMAARLAKAIPPQMLSPEQKDIPPQAQAVMQHMDQQIKQLTAELQKAMAALTDKNADRQQAQDKIDKDFEAKLMAVVQKAEANFNTHIGAQLQELGAGVTTLIHAMESGATLPTTAPPAGDNGGTPASDAGAAPAQSAG